MSSALALSAVLLGAGCTAGSRTFGALTIAAPAVSPAVRALCARISAALPASVLPATHRRTVRPEPALTAAWGSPAVVLRCGLSQPVPAPASSLLTVDGIDWLLPGPQGPIRFVTYRLPATVSVDVPASYQGGDVLAALSPVLADTDRQR